MDNKSGSNHLLAQRLWPRSEATTGGYQVIKKWLSYREHDLLGRSITLGAAWEVTGMARRLASIILMEPALNANYQAVKAFCSPLPQS